MIYESKDSTCLLTNIHSIISIESSNTRIHNGVGCFMVKAPWPLTLALTYGR